MFVPSFYLCTVKLKIQCKVMTNKNLILPFYKINEIKMPFIVCKYNNNEGKETKGLFLIDSGSKDNILPQYVADTFDHLEYTNEVVNVCGLGENNSVCKTANAQVFLKGQEYCVRFNVSNDVNFDMMFGPGVMLGILGSSFLRQYELTVDFKNKCLRTSNEENGIAMKEDNFLFPMSCGMKSYGVPLVRFTNGGKTLYGVADSGANVSLMSQSGVKDMTEIELQDNECQISGIVSQNTINHTAIAAISLLSINEKDREHMKLIKVIDEFNLLPSDYVLNPGEDLPPISALIGTEFMLENKWILDYKHGFIYSSAA